MNAKLSERRVPMGETQRAVLALLREHGPKQRWQIAAEIGRDCATTINALLKAGRVEQYEDANMHPNPCNKQERTLATYVAWVADLDPPSRKGVSENSLK